MITGIDLVKLGMPHRLSLMEIQDIACKAVADPEQQIAFASQICKEATAHFNFQQIINMETEEAMERVAYFNQLEEQEDLAKSAIKQESTELELTNTTEAHGTSSISEAPPEHVVRSLDPLLSRVETNIERSRLLRENTRKAIELVRKSISLSRTATRRPYSLSKERFVGFDYADFVSSMESSC